MQNTIRSSILILILFSSYLSTGQSLGIGGTPPAFLPPLVQVQTPAAVNRWGFMHTDGTISVGSMVGSFQENSYGYLGTLSNHSLGLFPGGIFGSSIGVPRMTIHNGGWVGLGITNPSAPLHIANFSVNEPTTMVIGRNHTAGGYTAMYMGNTANTGGYNYIQSVNNSGSSFGMLALNPFGGNNVYTGLPTAAVDHSIVSSATVSQNVELEGSVKKQGNLVPLPLCIGVVSAEGVKLNGTPNFTVTRSGEADYYIQVSGETFTTANRHLYAVLVTTMGDRHRAKYEVSSDNGNNNIRITIYDASLSYTNAHCTNACPNFSSRLNRQPGDVSGTQFSFVVYKLN